MWWKPTMLPLFVLAVVLLVQYSSVESSCENPNPCSILILDLFNCTNNVAHLSTDQVSYKHAESTITASFDQDTTDGQHHYLFCYKYMLQVNPKTIDCVDGNTSVSVNFSWPLGGNADLLVLIFNSRSFSEETLLACAATNISIAWNYGLKLSVQLTDSSGVEPVQHDTFQHHCHTVGCILFVPTASLRNSSFSKIKQVYYSYDFGDGQHKEDSTEPNITHCYNTTGRYSYSVNAIAVLSEVLSLHTNLTGDMGLLDPCGVRTFDFSNCTEWEDLAFLSTDHVSYEHAESAITATFDQNTTNGQHYYDFCYKNIEHVNPQTIGCVHGNTSASVNFSWPLDGYADLLVMIYDASSYSEKSLPACATTNILIAQNDGLKLSLELTDFSEVERVQHGTLQQHYYTVGCILFVPTVSLTKFNDSNIEQMYYSYDFGDGQHKEDSTEPNITHCYNTTGRYSYSVNAIAVLAQLLSLHTNLTGDMELLEEVDQISMVVNGDNSVIVGSKAAVTISATGSFPIKACWNITLSSNTSVPINPINASSTFQHCQDLNSTSTQVMMTFNQTGRFAFIARFQNDVSYKSDVFSYSVITDPSPAPALVASSTTAVVLGVLIAIVAVIIVLIVGVYIPYRRYRNRLTETADFKFVDLSEGRSYWQRAKVTANRVVDRVRRPSETQKMGLVNLIAMETEGEQNVLYGSTKSIR